LLASWGAGGLDCRPRPRNAVISGQRAVFAIFSAKSAIFFDFPAKKRGKRLTIAHF
jgi:hypothetical protein